jgi:hypothetical protein
MSRLPFVLLAGALLACSSGSSLAERTGSFAAPAAHAGATIGRIQMRDRTITLHASSAGLRVTVQDEAGAVLAQDVAVDELRTVDPLSYDVCRSSTAHRGEYLDALWYAPIDARVEGR